MGAGVVLVVGVKVVVMVENREAAEAVPAEAVPAEAAVAEAVEGTEQGTARFEVGVGPWEGPWPDGDHWDEELLREGDRRNVVDKYRYWSMDAIIADLDTRRHDSVPLETYDLPKKCVLVFGQEGPGLSEELHAAAKDTLSIEQFGSTRSMNAATAAGIAMHAWVRRHVFGQIPS